MRLIVMTGAPSISKEDIRAALNEIVDPCSVAAGAPAGLDDMGLVREVEVFADDNGTHLSVTIGLTQPICVMGFSFIRSAEDRLRQFPGVVDVEVSLTSGMDWSEARLAPAYATRLARARSVRRELIGDG